jgi:UPF0716 protein FxsA
MGYLFLLFTVVPAVEIYLLIQVGSAIGGLNTVIILLTMGVLGAYCVRTQGVSTLFRIQRALAEGRFPADELIDGAMVLVGGILLITPGYLSDAVGITFILPPTRSLWKRWAVRMARRKLERGEIVVRRY